MHVDEVPTDVGLVDRLVRGQFPAWAGLPITPVPSSGTDNAMYRLGDDLSVRLPRIGWAVPNVAREGEWVPWLADRLPVSLPVPIAQGTPGSGYPHPWSVCRWVEGVNPVVGAVDDPASLARQVAAFLLALRGLDATVGPPAKRGVPLADRDAPTRAAIAALHGAVDTAAVTAVWDAALALPAWSGPPTWAHGDLSPGNLLCDADGRLAAVIDFGGTGMGDPSVDLIVAWNLLPASCRARFRAELRVDDDQWRRGRGWALSIALIQLPYYRDTNPALAANSRHVIAEVLADARRVG